MAVITQGRKQYIVSTQTLLTWKRFQRDHPNAVVLDQYPDALVVAADDTKACHIHGKQLKECGP